MCKYPESALLITIKHHFNLVHGKSVVLGLLLQLYVESNVYLQYVAQREFRDDAVKSRN